MDESFNQLSFPFFDSGHTKLLVLVIYGSCQFGLLFPNSTQQFYQPSRVKVVLLGSPLCDGNESSFGSTVCPTDKELHSLRISLCTVSISVHVQKVLRDGKFVFVFLV